MSISEIYDIYLQYPSVVTDTRKLKEGDFFFALKGPNFNANTFAFKALEAGAAYCVVDEPLTTIATYYEGNNETHKEAALSKMIVVEGTLYPLLTRLKNAGLLEYKWVESKSGPPRKYYKLTEEGDNFLKGLSDTWEDLVHSTQMIQNKINS